MRFGGIPVKFSRDPARLSGIAKTILVLAAALALAGCAPPARPEAPPTSSPVPILRQAVDGPNPDGSYSWAFETGDGIQAGEAGALRALESATEAVAAQGGYSYTAPDGTPIQLSYVADENGFRAQGAHLPTPPPVPEAIQRALEWIAAHPEVNDVEGKRN